MVKQSIGELSLLSFDLKKNIRTVAHIQRYFLQDLDFEELEVNRQQALSLTYVKGSMILEVRCDDNDPIMVISQDCIRDYVKLKLMGVQFLGDIVYVDQGLCVKFIDTYGNAYILLEERNYDYRNI